MQITLNAREVAAAFSASLRCEASLFERRNAAPSQTLALLAGRAGGERRLVAGSWGFSLGDGQGPRPINARSETVAQNPAFRAAFAHRRAALPITGFYEWQAPDPDAPPPLFGGPADAAARRPWLIESADRGPFPLAAITVRGASGEAGAPVGFCVLTTAPNPGMARIHDRMPVILSPEGLGAWLNPSTPFERLHSLLRPCAAADLRFTPVSSRINRPANQGPESVEPTGPSISGATFMASRPA